jgi:transposase
MRTAHTPKQLEERRLKALAMLQDGLSTKSIAGQLKVTERSVRRWKVAISQGDRAALAPRHNTGRAKKMTEEQWLSLRMILNAGPEKLGFEAKAWTCALVRNAIMRHLSITYHIDHVRRLLREAGWRTMAKSRMHNGKPAIHWEWQKEEWPLKKSRKFRLQRTLFKQEWTRP